MPVLVQICVLVATVTFVAVSAAMILTMIRLGRAAEETTSATRASMTQVELIVGETRELVAAIRETILPAQRAVKHLERIGERAADLSGAVLDEIEEPVLTGVALARGVKTGTAHLLNLLTRRFAQRRSSNQGEQNHERHQQEQR